MKNTQTLEYFYQEVCQEFSCFTAQMIKLVSAENSSWKIPHGFDPFSWVEDTPLLPFLCKTKDLQEKWFLGSSQKMIETFSTKSEIFYYKTSFSPKRKHKITKNIEMRRN